MTDRLRNLSYQWLLVVSVSAFVAMPFSAPAQYKWLAEGSDYARTVNEITARFSELVNRSAEFENIAYAVANGEASADYASRQARRVSADLWSTFTQLSNQLQSIGEPPASVKDRNLRARLRNVRTMAVQSRSMAQTFITSGEDLVESAVAGDPNLFVEVEKRNVQLSAAQLSQQVATYEVHMAYEDKQGFSYYLTGAFKAQSQALLTLLNATLDVYETGDLVDFEEAQAEAESWVEAGFEFLDQGRKIVRNEIRYLKSRVPKHESERRMNELLLDLYGSNIPQSYELEERMLLEISNFVAKYTQITDEELNIFQIKTSAMEKERARLLLERQEHIASQ